jgi:proteasome accessory factor A
METCVKVLGADFELANAIESDSMRRGDVFRAARLLLREIDGLPRRDYWGGSEIEWGRRFLPTNGSSAYIDSDHLEINLPEHTRAEDHPAIVFAGLRTARDAQLAATAKLDDGRINVTCAVSDAKESWGHHLNVMVTRRLWDDMFYRKPHLAGFLAAHLVTSVLYTGQGKVGAGNGRLKCDYQVSQRADYFETFVGEQTTHRRPILNARDEAHAGNEFARMHLIYFDRALCPTAVYLMAGTTQLVLAMAEAGWVEVDLLLDDPVSAAQEVSRDLTLRRPLKLARRGRTMSAVDLQRLLADLAGEFVAEGLAEPPVPGAAEIVRCWQETLDLLKKRDLAALMRRCDWALKYLLLERHRGRKGLTWQDAEMQALDFRYSSLDPEEGLFWQMAESGQVDRMPPPARVERFHREPPDDSRAYLRTHVLRRFGEEVSDVDWCDIRFRLPGESYWYAQAILEMPDPTGFGCKESEALLARCATLRDLIVAVGGEEALSAGWSRRWGSSGGMSSTSTYPGLSRWW